VGEALGKLEGLIQQTEAQRAGAYAGMSQAIGDLREGHRELQKEAQKLVRALRAPAPRGRWGEIQLRRLAEMAGMAENCDFVEQESIATEEGRLRPDMIVRMPGGKTTVVDAKVPLVAYLDALEADDDGRRRALIADHARQVREHVNKLASKNYWDELPSSPDFVVMYIPLESAFSAALQEDPQLIDYAVDRKVIPCGPMTLLSHLKAVSYGWNQERITANAERIRELGKDLYDRVRSLMARFDALGQGLRRAVNEYNHTLGSLDHRVLPQVRKFRELGAATGEELPEPEPIDLELRQARAAGSPPARLQPRLFPPSEE
jgi:DNA recombination protein RmuC